jgi:hypothetical protein
MFDDSLPDEWLPVAVAHRHLRTWFRTQAALKHHLAKREVNGLTAVDAVRLSPIRRLIVNPRRVAAWVVGEGTREAA